MNPAFEQKKDGEGNDNPDEGREALVHEEKESREKRLEKEADNLCL